MWVQFDALHMSIYVIYFCNFFFFFSSELITMVVIVGSFFYNWTFSFWCDCDIIFPLLIGSVPTLCLISCGHVYRSQRYGEAEKEELLK